MIQQLIASCSIIPALEAKEKFAVFDEMLATLAEHQKMSTRDRNAIRKLLLEREEQGSTGLGNGVGVPHVKAKVEQVLLVLANTTEGIPFDSIDGRPVHTLFLVVTPKDQPDGHLQVLRWVSSLARNADFRRFVLKAESESEIRELLEEMSEDL